MIKTFESFKSNDMTFKDILRKMQLLYNDTIQSINLESILDDDLWYILMDRDGLLKDVGDIDIDSISEHQKKEIISKYNLITDKYDLSKLPDEDYIKDVLASLYDIETELNKPLIEVSYDLKDMTCKILIYTIPNVEKILNRNNWENHFDVKLYDVITNEIIPCVNRLKSKYKVDTYLSNIKVGYFCIRVYGYEKK